MASAWGVFTALDWLTDAMSRTTGKQDAIILFV